MLLKEVKVFVIAVKMAQKANNNTNEMFSEFHTVCLNSVNDNNEQSTSLGQLLTVLDDNQENCTERYQVIFTEYDDSANAAIINCDSEFDSEIYTIHIQETEDSICDSNVTLIKENPKQSIGNTLPIGSVSLKDPSLVKVNNISRGKKASHTKREAADVSPKITPKNHQDKGNYSYTIVHKSDADGDENEEKPFEKKKIYVEVTEQNLFALHGLDISLPISCDICNVNFDDMTKFDDHMRQHLDFRFYMCQLCSKSYRSWQNLVAHRKVWHDGQFISCNHCENQKGHHKLGQINFPVGIFPVGCEECHEGFMDDGELNRHYRCHDASDCEVKIEKSVQVSSEETKKHKEDNHGNDEVPSIQSETSTFNKNKKLHSEINVKYKCPFCSKVFKNMSVYKNHKSTHVGKILYKCKVCFKKFKSKKSLNIHQFSHPSKDKFRCFNCQMDFSEVSGLDYHIKNIHLQNLDIKLICDICVTNHPVKKFLKHYLNCYNSTKSQEMELEKSKVTCQICDKKFSSPKVLYQHMQIHESSRQSFLCDECGIVIHDVQIFRTHVNSHSKEKKRSLLELKGTLKQNPSKYKPKGQAKGIKCEMCCRSFKNRTDLQYHVRRHTGEKPYNCDSCSMAFYTKKHLSLHMQIHTQHPYKCGMCKNSFTTRRALLAHQKLHKSSKQYACPICSQKFQKRSTCRDHIQTHSGIKVHKCDDCSKSFLFKYNLNVHKKIHENEKLKELRHQCSDCGQSFAAPMELQNHHEEKCYLTMITFMPSSSNANKMRSLFLSENANKITSFSEAQ